VGVRETSERAPIREDAGAELARPRQTLLSIKNIAVLVAGVVLSSLLAIFTVGNYIGPAIEQRKTSIQAEVSTNNRDLDLEKLHFYSVGPVIVNPADSNGERYLKATISLETHDAELLKEIEKRLPQIKNQINNILSSKTIAQMQKNDDRERLRREIQNRVNGLLLGGHVANVYFEEFVYQ
jgi:flagellar FliL protein